MPPRIDKELVFFITDTGKNSPNGNANYFEKAKEAMALIIEKKIFLREHDQVGVMLVPHTDDDEMSTQLFCPNCIPSWEIVRRVGKLKKSDMIFEDWMEPLKSSLRYIQENWDDRVILILLFDDIPTLPGIENTNLQDIADSILQRKVQLLWIGGKPQNNPSDDNLNESEKALMDLMKLVDGTYMSIDETLPSLRIFKKIKSQHVGWKCDLEVGQIKIPITMYNQTSKRMKKASFQTVRIENVDGVEKLVVSKSEREYVDRYKQAHAVQDTIPAHMYGRQCIPVPDGNIKIAMQNAGLAYKGGPKSFKLFGFVRRDAINLEDLTGEIARIVVPQSPGSRCAINASKALYSLAKAMVNRNRVAVVRRMYRLNSRPKMGFLFPHIDVGEPWGLIFIELPYAENRRIPRSRNLSSVKKRLTDEKFNAVGDLIDSMMLKGSDTEPEPFQPGKVHAPGWQHFYNCLIHRALNPDKPLPQMDENLRKLIERPKNIEINSEPVLRKLKELYLLPTPEERIATKKSGSRSHDWPAGTAKVPVPLVPQSKFEVSSTPLKKVDKTETVVKDETKMEWASIPENVTDLDDLFAEDW